MWPSSWNARMRCSGMPLPMWMSRRRDVDPELHAQRPPERELALEPALGQDVDGVPGQRLDPHRARLSGRSEREAGSAEPERGRCDERRVERAHSRRVSHRCFSISEAALDQGTVIQRAGVGGCQRECTIRVWDRLCAAAVLVQRPRVGVKTLDARPEPQADPRTLERVGEVAVVVEVEQRRLDLIAAAVAGERRLERERAPVPVVRLVRVSLLCEDVAQPRRRAGIVDLRQCPAKQPLRPCSLPSPLRDVRKADERGAYAGTRASAARYCCTPSASRPFPLAGCRGGSAPRQPARNGPPRPPTSASPRSRRRVRRAARVRRKPARSRTASASATSSGRRPRSPAGSDRARGSRRRSARRPPRSSGRASGLAARARAIGRTDAVLRRDLPSRERQRVGSADPHRLAEPGLGDVPHVDADTRELELRVTALHLGLGSERPRSAAVSCPKRRRTGGRGGDRRHRPCRQGVRESCSDRHGFC